MPSETFTHTSIASAPPSRVYEELQSAETWMGIGPIDDVWGETHDEGHLTGFRWSARAAGRTWEGSASRTSAEVERSLSLDLDSEEIAGSITVDLVPSNDETEVTVTIVARSKGLLAGMFWGVVASAISRGLSQQVDRFVGRL